MVAKKWHVGKRLINKIADVTGLPTVEYLFDEEGCPLPDLGGVQSRLSKRARHRRAVLRLLFDFYGTNRLVVCMDPGSLDLLKDFFSDRSITRMLEIENTFSDEYLHGHAKRIGLAGDATSDAAFERLLPTIKSDLAFESNQIRDAGFGECYRINETLSSEMNAIALARFLSLSLDQAKEIAKADPLFFD